ncbi:hypothetical protein [Sphingomonas sp.]|uniref:hypothetical protein n=1 Tax=Sphingomonas sp. TaxID=28214 RepID=UPI0025EF0943|nr:hypothetical protein [Sphingomonas sp.]MBV9527161.1 hypothetical protein [Sphingomonas sp.]
MTPLDATRFVWQLIERGMFSWYELKMFVEHAAIITSDALHVLAGIAVWIVAGLAQRRPLTGWLPWLWVLAAILLNETIDLWVEQWPIAAMQYGESAKDVMLTMIVPTLLMAAARWRPNLFAARARTPRRSRRR